MVPWSMVKGQRGGRPFNSFIPTFMRLLLLQRRVDSFLELSTTLIEIKCHINCKFELTRDVGVLWYCVKSRVAYIGDTSSLAGFCKLLALASWYFGQYFF